MDVGLLILRVVVGGLFIGHGTQKLFGWFGGGGLDGTGGWYESLGHRPGRRMAAVAGTAEAGGGLLLVLGLLTPLGSAAILGVMIAATLAVHIDKGLWNANGGFEFPLVMATAALALAMVGPGSISLDEALDLANGGVAEGLGALVLGGGLAFLFEVRRRAMLEEAEIEEEAPANEDRPAA
jgi:putative oxidoreductase